MPATLRSPPLLARLARWLGMLALLVAGQALGDGAFDQSRDGFVNNDLCTGCHANQALAWRQSHHGLSMQPANAHTVLGNFDNARFSAEGLEALFQHKGTQYQVTVKEAGKEETLAVAWTFGVDPLQQYLVSMPNGRLQAFPVAWDTRSKRWFHLQAGDGIHSGDALHWRERFYVANSSCIGCHTTDFQLGYDITRKQYQSSAAGHNVNCQACHGPGGKHLAWTRQPDPSKPGKGWDDKPLQAPKRVMDVCGTCHARRHALTPQMAWAAPLLDQVMPQLLSPSLYYPDGQIEDEDFEYGSFTQSKMHEAGVTCINCHNPHTLKPRIAGNGLCISCHEAGNPRFPVLKPGQYNTAAHHHHREGSAGSQCVNCHMPTRTYMKVDARHDHRFGIPRPDLSLSIGVPNACNQCHTDRDAKWAQAAIVKWYPQGRYTQPDRGTTIAAARRGDPRTLPALQLMAGDARQPAIWRATAVELLSGFGPETVQAITPALKDASPLVRASAVTAFASQEAPVRQQTLAPLLRDPSRAVRTEAARLLADIPAERFSATDQPFLQKALGEYRAAQAALPDHPEGHTNLGQLAWQQGNTADAIRELETAIATDRHFIPAYETLAILYSQAGQTARSVGLLQKALPNALPEQRADLYYSLGLAQAELGRMQEARQALAKAIAANPQHTGAHYNLGLLLQQSGDEAGAITQLQQALAQNTRDDRTRYALAQLYMKRQQYRDALPLLQTLLQHYPQEAELQGLLQQAQNKGRTP